MTTNHKPRADVLLESVRRDLIQYLVTRHSGDVATDISGETPLLTEGIIDSLSMMSLILFLENKYHLDFLTIEITRAEFASVNVLADFVVDAVARS